jgi:hypothetical protein
MSKNNIYLIIFLFAAGVIIAAAFSLFKVPSMEIANINFSKISIPKGNPQTLKPVQRPSGGNAILSLAAQNTIPMVGEEIKLNLEADTGAQEVAGIDVVLRYNPAALQFKRAEGLSGLNLVSSTRQETGKELRFSLLSPPDQQIAGQITAANLYFKALAPGKTEVSFVFGGLSLLDDSQIVSTQGKDILGNVQDVAVMIIAAAQD